MNKKQFALVMTMWIFLSALTAVFMAMPSTIGMFLVAFAVCFIFCGCLFFLPFLFDFDLLTYRINRLKLLKKRLPNDPQLKKIEFKD